MRDYLLLLFFCLSSQLVCSQSITGKVQESDGKPMPFVNVLLLDSKDSTLVKGAVTDENGKYTVENVRQGNYLLAAAMVGYKRTYSAPLTIKEEQGEVNIPLLTLTYDTRQLKEVSVVTTRPFVEQEIDRTVVNVANSIIASGSTALEVLEKAPGVTIDRQNDAIALRGKDGVIVMIDGKQTYLAMADVVALLRSTPSDNIDKIELITNPSAKYDAAGNSGIINIRMKKNNNLGTNGSLSVTAGFGRYDRERASLQVNHRSRKLNLFGNISANRSSNYWTLEVDQDRLKGDERTIIYQNMYLRFYDLGQNGRAGFDYAISKQTTVGLVWTGYWSSHKEEGPATSLFRNQTAGPVYLRAQTDRKTSSVFFNQVANLNFGHTFGAKGGQLTVDADMGRFNRDFSNSLLTQTIRTGQPSPSVDGLLNEMPTTIDIRTLKTDYNRKLRSNWKMETGYKYSFVRTDNDLTFSSGPAGELQPDPLLSNHFQYTERVNAAYISFSGKLDAKTELLLGLRAEHTHSEGNSLTLNKVVERNYLNLFPSIFISRPLNKDHQVSLSYSRRIDRPSYEALNPARSYTDPFFYLQGNAYLQPQYTQALEFKHGYRGKIFTSLGASYINALIFNLTQPVNSSTSERVPLNLGKSQVYNLTLSFPVKIMNGWTLQTTLLGFYSQFQYTYQEIDFSVQQFSGRLNATSAMIFGKGWSAELTGWINAPRLNATTRYPWRASVDAGIGKTITSKLKAKLSLQDIFYSNTHIAEIRIPDFHRYYELTFDTRVVMLNLTYTFGNQQMKSIRQRKTGSEEEMQRTN